MTNKVGWMEYFLISIYENMLGKAFILHFYRALLAQWSLQMRSKGRDSLVYDKYDAQEISSMISIG